MNSITVIAWIGAITGTSGLAWDVIKWRLDRKPRLKVSVSKNPFTYSVPDHVSEQMIKYEPSLNITVRNPSADLVRIESVGYFQDGTLCILPVNVDSIREVPPKHKRTLSISLATMTGWIKDFPILNPQRCRFVLTDELGNQYTTVRWRHLISEELVENGLHLDI